MSRCAECGTPLTRTLAVCPEHPDAERVKWGASRVYAYHYVCHEARRGLAGEELDRFVETYDEREWPGTNRGDMALVLSYARTWKREEYQETGLPDIVQQLLYGRRPGQAVAS